MAKDKNPFEATSLAKSNPGGNAARQALVWSPEISVIAESQPTLMEIKKMLDDKNINGANERAKDLLANLKPIDKKQRKIVRPFLMLINGDYKSEAGVHDEAETVYSEAAKEAKKGGDKLMYSVAMCFLGMNMWARGRLDDALKQFDQAVKSNNRYVQALINRGVALIEKGKAKKAIGEFDKALAVDMNNSLAWVNKAAALIRIGKYKDALVLLEMALASNRGNALANYNKGLVLERLKKPNDAAACYEAAFDGKDELPDNGEQLYFAWVNLMLTAVLKTIASNDMKKADKLILDFKRLTASAASDGVGDRIDDAVELYKSNITKKEKEHFSVFEYKMQTVQDAMVLWGALGDWVSRKWPDDLTVAKVLKGAI